MIRVCHINGVFVQAKCLVSILCCIRLAILMNSFDKMSGKWMIVRVLNGQNTKAMTSREELLIECVLSRGCSTNANFTHLKCLGWAKFAGL